MHHTHLGKGHPLLLLHGLLDSHRTWDRLIPCLSDQFTLLAVDLPGFGKSPLPIVWKDSLSGMVEEVITFLHREGIRQVTCVGSSMGGSLALAIAIKYPESVENIILLNPYVLPEMPRVGLLIQDSFLGRLLPYLLGEPVLHYCAKTIYARSLYNHRLINQQLIDEMIQPFLSLSQRRDLIRFLRGISSKEIMEIEASLSKIYQPLLVLWGECDRWLTKGHLLHIQNRLPQCKTMLIPACGHLPQMEMPKETAEAIRLFLKIKSMR